jgi:Ca2+-binding RTX toxin-like protein
MGIVSQRQTTKIAFTLGDNTWTVEKDASVAVSADYGAFSDIGGSTLVNHGLIFSGWSGGSQACVTFLGDNATIVNKAGASIVGYEGGVVVNGNHVSVTNNGSMTGADEFGFLFGNLSQHVVLDNKGDIYGGDRGVWILTALDGGTIHNSGTIRSASVGVGVTSQPGLTTTIVNEAGGLIRGSDKAIEVNFGALSLDNRGTLAGDLDCNESANDTVVNSGKIKGTVSLGGGNDTFNGKGGTSGAVFGEDGNDKLTGGKKGDTLDGGFGNDKLTGHGGKDHFVFDETLDPALNLDRITDFAPGTDRIVLDKSVFVHAGGLGTLAGKAFHVGTHAGDHSDRIIYDDATGKLFYDDDGKNGVNQIQFAKLDKGLHLHATDFLVIA